MIWGRSTADDSRTCFHVPLKHTACVVTRLHTRPMPSVTAPINKSRDANSRAAEITVIRILTPRAQLRVFWPTLLRAAVSQPIASVALPIGRSSAANSRYASIPAIGPSTRLHAPSEVFSSLIHGPTRRPPATRVFHAPTMFLCHVNPSHVSVSDPDQISQPGQSG
jgi:hypothetical protein